MNKLITISIVIIFIIIIYNIIIPRDPIINYKDQNRILYLCGTHGNESAPCDYFKDEDDLSYIIVNPSACSINKRTYFFQKDLNRNYPNTVTTNYNTNTNIIIPYLHNNKLIVDFHESWGFEYPSIGQTIFVNKYVDINIIQEIVNTINNKYKNANFKLITRLPYINGTLDNYCDINKLPYILVEIAGQNDIQPRDLRVEYTREIVKQLEFNF